MKVVAAKRRRFGYPRIGVMLERKGMIMNHKKLYRLYTEEKLASGDEGAENGRAGHGCQRRRKTQGDVGFAGT